MTLESIFEVGFEFFGVFQLGLAGNEESRRKWWVTAGSVVAGEVRKKKKKKKKTRCVREEREKKKKKGCIGCYDFILNLCIFLKRMRCQFMIRGKKPHFFAMAIFKMLCLVSRGVLDLKKKKEKEKKKK